MPHVSKHKLDKKAEKQLVGSLNLVLSSISKREEMLLFLNSLLTDTERLMFGKRLAIIVLLSENLSDTQIANALNVTRITVAKMRYYYEARGKEGYDIALKKIESEKTLRQVKKLLLSLTRYAIRAAGGYVKPGILD